MSFTIQSGETIGIVGESGSGKSVTAFTLMGVLDRAGKVTAGRALFQSDRVAVDLLKEPESSLRQLRGKELSMIFQNPRTALNPIRKVGKQITDVLQGMGVSYEFICVDDGSTDGSTQALSKLVGEYANVRAVWKQPIV